MKKILVMQTAFLGDVILSTPLVRALDEEFEDARVDTLTIPANRSIFEQNPHVRKTLVFEKRPWYRKTVSFLKVLFLLRKEKYDLAFSLQGSLTSSFLMLLGGIRIRAGFSRQKFITDRVVRDEKLHVKDRYLSLLDPFSGTSRNYQTELFWSEQEEIRPRQILNDPRIKGKKLIAIAPGSLWNTKRWPEEHFTALIRLLEEAGFGIVLVGGPLDRELCDRFLERSGAAAVNVAGSLSILESAALVAAVDLMITNDSAPLHIANATGTTVFALFGPTVRRFGCYPYREGDRLLEIDLDCRPCSKHGGARCPLRHFRCMKEIAPRMVYEEIITFFEKK